MGGYATINQFYRVLCGNPIENGVTTQSPLSLAMSLAKAWYFTSLVLMDTFDTIRGYIHENCFFFAWVAFRLTRA
jgi:hypothetical protein